MSTYNLSARTQTPEGTQNPVAGDEADPGRILLALNMPKDSGLSTNPKEFIEQLRKFATPADSKYFETLSDSQLLETSALHNSWGLFTLFEAQRRQQAAIEFAQQTMNQRRELQGQLDQARIDIRALESRNKKLEGSLNSKKQALQTAQAKEVSLSAQLTKAEKNNENLVEELQKCMADLAEQTSERDTLAANVQEWQVQAQRYAEKAARYRQDRAYEKAKADMEKELHGIQTSLLLYRQVKAGELPELSNEQMADLEEYVAKAKAGELMLDITEIPDSDAEGAEAAEGESHTHEEEVDQQTCEVPIQTEKGTDAKAVVEDERVDEVATESVPMNANPSGEVPIAAIPLRIAAPCDQTVADPTQPEATNSVTDPEADDKQEKVQNEPKDSNTANSSDI